MHLFSFINKLPNSASLAEANAILKRLHFICIGPLYCGNFVGGLVAFYGFFFTYKYPPDRIGALVSHRYDASL